MRRIAALSAVLCAVSLGAGLARAETVQEGNVILSFEAGFTPQSLPRYREIPVSVRVGGSIKSPDGGRPPTVRRISFAVNRYGRVFTRGLPSCDRASLEATSTAQAMEQCRSSHVGGGFFIAAVDPPSGEPFSARGQVLAFNSRTNGRHSLLLHVHARTPAQVTVVLAFRIHHPRHGQFGTVFSTRIPAVASNLGYITRMSLHFERRFSFRGRVHSYFSARCAAPPALPGAIFTFARGRFVFDNGQRLTSRLIRSCNVR
jgi:hypothetical protein